MSETTAPDDELLADVEEAMRDVVDPELGINVVDLGLVYGLNIEEGDEGTVALIDMTLTSAACPLTRSAWKCPDVRRSRIGDAMWHITNWTAPMLPSSSQRFAVWTKGL